MRRDVEVIWVVVVRLVLVVGFGVVVVVGLLISGLDKETEEQKIIIVSDFKQQRNFQLYSKSNLRSNWFLRPRTFSHNNYRAFKSFSSFAQHAFSSEATSELSPADNESACECWKSHSWSRANNWRLTKQTNCAISTSHHIRHNTWIRADIVLAKI